MTNCKICNWNEMEDVPKEEILGAIQSGTQFETEDLRYSLCKGCGTMFCNSANKGKLKKLYKGQYKKPYSLKKRILLRIPYSTHYKDKIEYLNKMKLKKGKLLDVGCSEGKFMWLMKLGGWKTKGIEPSDCADFRKNPDITRCELKDYPSREKFDLVTCFGVLEHIPDFRRFLLDMRNLTRKGGKIFIVVPTRSYAMEHLTLFSATGLLTLATQCRLKPIKISLIDNKKIFLIAER